MKSLRLSTDLSAKLERAARASNMSQSEFIREAVERRCCEVLGNSLAERLRPVIGAIESAGGRADDTGAAFRRAVAKQERRR